MSESNHVIGLAPIASACLQCPACCHSVAHRTIASTNFAMHHTSPLYPEVWESSHSACAGFLDFQVFNRYSPMSEVCAPRYLAGFVPTHG